jgi:hypothetical protein
MTEISIIEKSWGLNVISFNQLYAIYISYNYKNKTFSTIVMDGDGNDVPLNSDIQRVIEDYKKHTILKEI